MKEKPLPKDFSHRFTEREIHLHCWQWVQKNCPSNILIFHVPNGEARNLQVALLLKRMGVIPGVADFLMFIYGKSIAIEIKDHKGKQSDAQKQFQKRWEAAGNRYELVRSLEEFKDVVQICSFPW